MKDRVVIITGGGTGIGRAAAFQFVREGARVMIVGRRAAPLQEVAALSDRILPIPADLFCKIGHRVEAGHDRKAALFLSAAVQRAQRQHRRQRRRQ